MLARPEERIQEIIDAYRLAHAAGQSFDLAAVLAQEPGLGEKVRAQLGLGEADLPACERATLSAVQIAPPPEAEVPLSQRTTALVTPNAPAPEDATPACERPTLTVVRSTPAEAETLSFKRSDGLAAPLGLGDFGDYELLEEIARGGMGVVFRAREKSLNRIVALKMILTGRLASSDEVRRFRMEAEEASHLDHPNIVPIYHIGEVAGQHYFTMKMIEGGTLRYQDNSPKADPRQIARLVAAVAHAVHYAHRHGVLHRDLKPGNILIDAEGRPHVTDFGLAKHMGGPAGQTHTGDILGTPGYISPEQAASRKDLTTATDIYSMGAVLYYLITGQPPFQAPTALDALVKVLEQEPVTPRRLNPRLDRDLETICLTCLNKDPRRRYASAEALAHDLERFLAGEPIHARRVSRVERARKWVRRRPLAAALTAVLCGAALLLAGGGWVFSVRLQAAVHQAQEAQAVAETGEKEASRKRQELNDYLVYLNERLANLKVDQPIRLEFLRQGLAMCEQSKKGHGDDTEARRQTALLYRCLGDLEQERSDPERSTEAYRRALEMLEQLDTDCPGVALYRHDLAVTYSKLAHFQQTSGEHGQALATLQQAIEVQDGLAAEPSADVKYRQRAAEFRLTLGTYLEEQKKPAAAETAYRAALERLEHLVADRAAPATTHGQFASTAGVFAWLLAASKPAEAEGLFQRSLRELREARTAQPDNRDFSQGLYDAYMDLAAFFKQRGQHAELAALAQQLRADFLGNQEQAYNAARFLTDAIRVVARQQALPPPQRDALTEDYAAAAVAMLDKAVKEGSANRARIEVDPDLDPLRQRKDFGALMTELERRSPNLSAEQELAVLQGLFERARQQYRYQMDGARTQAELQRALAVKPDLQTYAEKFLQLAQKRRDSHAGMEALVVVLETCNAEEVGPAATRIRQQAALGLEKDYLHKPEFGTVCQRFARVAVPEADKLLQEALKRHPQRDVRGLAGLTVALNLARAVNLARKADPGRAEELSRQAEQQLEGLLKEYGNVQVGRNSLGEIASHELDEVRYLSVSSPARDIIGEDLQGQSFKLSDYRGKVVVLDFWADWCGFCRHMYPHEQELVRRYKDRPFALLGINCDEDRDAIRHMVARRGLTWRSWWDGGPDGGRIRQAWHIGGYPSIWVLDHKHVIRFRAVRGKELDDAVAQLVKEAEADPARTK